MSIDATMLELSDGSVALIDREDLGRVAGYEWELPRSGAVRLPMTRVCSNRRFCEEIFLHRLIANAGPDDIVYHRNHNTLDNRQDNLIVLSRERAPMLLPVTSTDAQVAD
jgi:hypothetical protein